MYFMKNSKSNFFIVSKIDKHAPNATSVGWFLQPYLLSKMRCIDCAIKGAGVGGRGMS